mmetsp:Transcript_33117/g.98505  ORF Transcript_33117/g.98505 Transcript_33117/m.98505 type:complete len:227 (-) Transcript_33117:269-949(-)
MQAANAEMQELAASGLQDTVTMAYQASALHKCEVFAQACGAPAAAEALGRASTALMKKTMGEEDGLVAATMLGLAEVLLCSGKLDEAEAYYRSAVQLQATVQGEDNPDTLRAVRQLALVLKRQGKLDEAEQLYEQNLHHYKAIYGPDSFIYATGLMQLSALKLKLRDFATATELAEKALALNEGSLGARHPTTLQSYQLCKNVARQAGDRAAWERHSTALKLRLSL